MLRTQNSILNFLIQIYTLSIGSYLPTYKILQNQTNVTIFRLNFSLISTRFSLNSEFGYSTKNLWGYYWTLKTRLGILNKK